MSKEWLEGNPHGIPLPMETSYVIGRSPSLIGNVFTHGECVELALPLVDHPEVLALRPVFPPQVGAHVVVDFG